MNINLFFPEYLINRWKDIQKLYIANIKNIIIKKISNIDDIIIK